MPYTGQFSFTSSDQMLDHEQCDPDIQDPIFVEELEYAKTEKRLLKVVMLENYPTESKANQ